MDLHILSKKLEDGHACYLCEATLEEYISELPEDYYRYDIQRGIESNVYLDNLIDTVLKNRHIPPIVLVVENNDYQYRSDDVSAYKILPQACYLRLFIIIRITQSPWNIAFREMNSGLKFGQICLPESKFIRCFFSMQDINN